MRIIKNRKRLILSLVICFVTVISGMMVTKHYFSWNRHAVDRFGDFWDDPGRYDVWLMGSSHTYYSIYPMELFRGYGIISYDIAAPSSTLPQTYWTMMNALESGTPKVIVVDVYHIDMNKPIVDMEKKVRIGFDAIPLSGTKLKMIDDLVENKALARDLIIPIYKEHGKLAKSLKKDKSQNYSLNRGAFISSEIKSVQGIVAKDGLSEKSLGTEYLEKIIEVCREREINLVIAAFPYVGEIEKQKGIHTGLRIAEEQGVPFVDLSYCPNVLNYDYDFAQDGHLNISGALKITRLIGNYLIENFNLNDYRNSESGRQWIDDIGVYKEFITTKMQEETNLSSYLLWTKFDFLKPYLFIEDETMLSKDEVDIIDSLTRKQMMSEDEYVKYTGEKTKGNICICVEDTERKAIVDTAYFP